MYNRNAIITMFTNPQIGHYVKTLQVSSFTGFLHLLLEEQVKKFKFDENKGNSVLLQNLCHFLKILLTLILDDDDNNDYYCYLSVVSITPEIEGGVLLLVSYLYSFIQHILTSSLSSSYFVVRELLNALI